VRKTIPRAMNTALVSLLTIATIKNKIAAIK
jgi:hypothetical protein